MEGPKDELSPTRVEQALAGVVNIAGEAHVFGEITADQARAQAAELKSAGNWGPLQRVVKVAMAWMELGAVIEKAGVGTVGDLDEETIVTWAERVWVLAPEDGMI